MNLVLAVLKLIVYIIMLYGCSRGFVEFSIVEVFKYYVSITMEKE